MAEVHKHGHKGNSISSKIVDGAVFLRRFIGAPRQVGSVTPSSRYLTRAVIDKIDWDNAMSVAELGAGTGVFTRSILKKIKPDAQLMVFEIDPALKKVIESENEGVTVYGDARDLPKIMKERGISQLDYAVSSLPFAVLPPKMTVAILDAIDMCLKPDGKMIAYQYSKHMKPYFEKRFKSVKISFVLRNVFPAFVYECSEPVKTVKNTDKQD